MPSDSKHAPARDLDRLNLRLDAKTFTDIDSARALRPGSVSRNTWITEAIEEKLARDRRAASQGWRAHG